MNLTEKFLTSVIENINTPSTHLKSVGDDLTNIGVTYCYIGGVALAPHNFSRYTEDIDILISKDSLPLLSELHGKGYTLRPGSSLNMYLYTPSKKIPIDFYVEADIWENILIPNPALLRVKINGVWFISLPHLIEFKLNAGRPQDHADVIALIKANELTSSFVAKLDPNFKLDFLDLLSEI
ncbi:MAG: hypothetical protein HQK56_15415 [Deltaproteobacteria bacterium]|nr:hypothetical protein [Deltaproteobacteria bacterium]